MSRMIPRSGPVMIGIACATGPRATTQNRNPPQKTRGHVMTRIAAVVGSFRVGVVRVCMGVALLLVIVSSDCTHLVVR